MESVELSKDQTGSRYIQQLLDSGLLTLNEIHELFIRILTYTNELTMDPFGNYVMQKLVDLIPEKNRRILLKELEGKYLSLSTHMYGCRVVQRLIETTGPECQLSIVSELAGHIVECVEDQNANHVVQKLIERLPVEHLSCIVREFIGHIPRMGVHCYGCRVVQRLIEKLTPSTNNGSQADVLIGEILAHLWQLSQDQYGNYVIQHVLTHGSHQHKSVIIQVIASHIVDFSCHKYASNIAEKALLCSNDQASRDLIISAVIGSGGPDSPLQALMKDRFANYVIQRCLEFSHGQQRIVLINILKSNLPLLKGVIYGKHIACAIEKIIDSA
jgi:pumilio RNA-binding family